MLLKRGTGNEEGELENEKWEQNGEWVMKVLTRIYSHFSYDRTYSYYISLDSTFAKFALISRTRGSVGLSTLRRSVA